MKALFIVRQTWCCNALLYTLDN